MMRSLTHAALDTANWLVHRLSVEQISWLGSKIGPLLCTRTKRNARALANLEIALPQTNAVERKAMVQAMWENFGRTVAETLLLDKIVAEPDRVTLANPEVLNESASDDRGTVFVGLHYGNWELMAIPLPQHGTTPMCVFRPLKNETINDWIFQQRERFCPGGLYPVSRATILRMIRHVRDGGSICIAGDHRDSNGPVVPFFGQPAPSVALPAMLAVRHNARVFTLRVDRLPRSRFSAVLEEIEVTRTGDTETDTLATTATIQAGLERWIRADPGRWLWFYKRWGKDADPLSTSQSTEDNSV